MWNIAGRARGEPLDRGGSSGKIFSMANRNVNRRSGAESLGRGAKRSAESVAADSREKGGTMKEDERKRLAEDIIDGMEQVMRIRGAVFREELERFGVTLPQFHLLKMIKLHGPLTVTEASRMMLVATPTASRMIGALCDRGMLRRYGQPGDQRVSRVALTRRGLAVVDKVAEMQVSLIMELLEGVGREELRSFASVLRRLVDPWESGGDG
jgi:DNA-binding MarR family transcriptional regulator